MSGDFGCISHYNAQKWSKHGFRYKITAIPLYQNDGYSLGTNPHFDTNAPPFEVRGCKVILGGAFLSQGVQMTLNSSMLLFNADTFSL